MQLCRPVKSGFTLIELILVLVILGVVTAVTVPAVVSSIRGNRLRVASRTVIRMGRYARSMAVLKQQPMVVKFDITKGQVGAISKGESGENLIRKLDRVAIREIRLTGQDKVTEGSCEIIYQSNGRCKPYEIVLVDEFDTVVTIEVDALSSPKTSGEDA
jgi:type II secretion system protein H